MLEFVDDNVNREAEPVQTRQYSCTKGILTFGIQL